MNTLSSTTVHEIRERLGTYRAFWICFPEEKVWRPDSRVAIPTATSCVWRKPVSFSVRTQWWIVAFLVAIGISSVWYVTKSPRYGFVLAGQQAPMIGGLRRVGPKLGYNVESGQVGTGPALIVVFASWCAACRQEMPSLEALSTRFKTQGLH